MTGIGKRLAGRLAALAVAAAGIVAAGCAVVDSSGPSGADRGARWALLPFANHTETPMAGNRAEAITEALLLSRGVAGVARYPASLAEDGLFEADAARRTDEQARAWARTSGARYAVGGAVDEWRYKVGVDGEPAVGVALTIVDLADGRVIWSGVGGKSGWSREALAAVAQKLIGELLDQALAAPGK
jgi:hypothetical protein